MHLDLVRPCRAPFLIFPAALALIASPATAQIDSSATRQDRRLRDSTQAALVACDVAASIRTDSTPTRCHLEAVVETRTEFIVRLRETPRDPGTNLEFPRSEVRLQKDGTRAIVTRIPDL